VEAAEPDLRVILQSVVDDPKLAGLKFYRNLAAHRGVIGEQQLGRWIVGKNMEAMGS